jgi:hypothetical protein
MISVDGGWWESKAEGSGELGVMVIAEVVTGSQLRRYSKEAVRSNGCPGDGRRDPSI